MGKSRFCVINKKNVYSLIEFIFERGEDSLQKNSSEFSLKRYCEKYYTLFK